MASLVEEVMNAEVRKKGKPARRFWPSLDACGVDVAEIESQTFREVRPASANRR